MLGGTTALGENDVKGMDISSPLFLNHGPDISLLKLLLEDYKKIFF